MRQSFSEQELLEAIQSGGQLLDQAMNYIYQKNEYKESVTKFVLQRSGTQKDVEDVFQEGICDLIVNIRDGKFKGKSSIKTYLTAICKNIWFTRFKRQEHLENIKSKISEGAKPEMDKGPEDQFILSETSDLLNDLLSKLTAECQQVLSMWALGYSFKEIGAQMSKKEGTVRKQKHSCFKSLMALLKNRPDLMEELARL